eukprot:204237_1
MVTFLAILCIFHISNAATSYTVTVNAHYPTSKLHKTDYISLRGDTFGLNWNTGIRMTSPSNNLYTTTITGSITYGTQNNHTFSCKVLINDKTWMIGVNAMFSFIQNQTPNTVTVNIYPFFTSYKGQYSIPIKNLHSPQLNNRRNILIYTPPSFYENPFKIYNNIIIMHDGENLCNASTSFGGTPWDIQDTIDQQVDQANIEEVIVIGVYNTGARIYEYDYSYDINYGDGGGADYYMDFVIDTVIPTVKELDMMKGRINGNLSEFGVIGSSLGGILSCFMGWSKPDIFIKNGCMSSSFWWNNFDYNTTIIHHKGVNDIMPQKIWIDVGSAESPIQIQGAEMVRDSLIALYGYKLGNNLQFFEQTGGQHNEYWWGKRFYRTMQFLYPPTPIVV